MRDGSKTRERIERRAMRLFVEKGVAETSIRDVAQAAGVADGALYRHFKGKEDLVAKLFTGHYLGFAQTLDKLQASATDTRAKLRGMITEFCRFFDEDEFLFRFLLFVQHGQLTKLPAKSLTPVEVIRRVIVAGIRQGEIPRGEPELLAAMVVGLVLQAATAIVYGRIRGSLSPHASRLSTAGWAVLTHT